MSWRNGTRHWRWPCQIRDGPGPSISSSFPRGGGSHRTRRVGDGHQRAFTGNEDEKSHGAPCLQGTQQERTSTGGQGEGQRKRQREEGPKGPRAVDTRGRRGQTSADLKENVQREGERSRTPLPRRRPLGHMPRDASQTATESIATESTGCVPEPFDEPLHPDAVDDLSDVAVETLPQVKSLNFTVADCLDDWADQVKAVYLG